jgi:hypothetical protein
MVLKERKQYAIKLREWHQLCEVECDISRGEVRDFHEVRRWCRLLGEVPLGLIGACAGIHH